MKILAERVGRCALSRRAFRCLSLCKRQPAAISPSFANLVSPFRLFALDSIISPRTLSVRPLPMSILPTDLDLTATQVQTSSRHKSPAMAQLCCFRECTTDTAVRSESQTVVALRRHSGSKTPHASFTQVPAQRSKLDSAADI